MKFSPALFLGLYKSSLHLYPESFRQRYAEQLIDAARLQQSDSTNDLALTASLLWDTLRSALREHLRAATPTRPGYVAAFALFFTFLLLTVSVVHQQILRRGADRRPAFIAQFISRRSPQDPSIAASLAAPRQEISAASWLNSASPFVALYDTSAHALTGNATLHGALPQPPIGIFNEMRSHDADEVTWRPEPGIRIALSGRLMPNGGYVVTGQSLAPSEARTARLNRLLRWMWAFAMLACCALVLSTRKHRLTPQPNATK